MGAAAFKVYHLQTVVVFGRICTGIVASRTQDLKEDLVTVESVLKVLGLTSRNVFRIGNKD